MSVIARSPEDIGPNVLSMSGLLDRRNHSTSSVSRHLPDRIPAEQGTMEALNLKPYTTDVVWVLCGDAGVLKSSNELSAASGLPVLAFDWASVYALGLMPRAYNGIPVPGLIAGYFKDTEVCVAHLHHAQSCGPSSSCQGTHFKQNTSCRPS